MNLGLRLVLLLFALVGFGGAGAALAVARYRELADGASDFGMVGVAAMLFFFGALCTSVGAGSVGIPAFGGVIAWVSYVLMGQHMELFRIEIHSARWVPEEAGETPPTRK